MVIAIIAILASILFPVFARARENARRASCQNNVKQIGLGFAQYAQDYDERYPGTSYYQSGGQYFSNDYITWAEVLYPYIKSVQVFKCPSTQHSQFGNVVGLSIIRMPYCVATFQPGGVDKGAFYSYAGTAGYHLAEFTDTAQTFLMGEPIDAVLKNYQYVLYPSIAEDNQTVSTPTFGRAPGQVHFEGGNWLFADGHVKYMSTDKVGATINGTANYYWYKVKP